MKSLEELKKEYKNKNNTINISARDLAVAETVDTLIIGAGIYGLHIGELLNKNNITHKIVAKNYYLDFEDDFYSKTNSRIPMASLANGARINSGYMNYNQKIDTIKNDLNNYTKFIDEFNNELIVPKDYNNLYTLDENNNKVKDWAKAIKNIGKKYNAEETHNDALNSVKEIYNINEAAIDPFRMMERKTYNYLKESANTNCNGIILDEISRAVRSDGYWYIKLKEKSQLIKAKYIFNCTYSGIKEVEKIFNIDTNINLLYDICELVLFTSGIMDGENLNNNAFTILNKDKFKSITPFCYSKIITSDNISNWVFADETYNKYAESYDYNTIREEFTCGSLRTNKVDMLKSISQYVGLLDKEKYKKSIFTIRTKDIDNKDTNLIIKNDETNTFYSILGNKLSSIYELNEIINNIFKEKDK